MRCALLLLAASSPRAPAASDEPRAFVEVAVGRDHCFVQEPITLRLRFGVDARFFESHAIQPFQRRLDLPVKIEARWLDEPPATLQRRASADSAAPLAIGRGRTVVLNDAVVAAAPAGERVVAGRSFETFEIERSFLATAEGALVIPGPRLRFAAASRFEDDPIRGRVAADRNDELVEGRPMTLRVDPLPEEGRPARFGGAVGRFTIEAEAGPTTLAVGEIMKLALRIEGDGNVESFPTPILDELDGFHVYGVVDVKELRHRTVTFDLAPLRAEVDELPPIPFSFFDPEPPARYRTVATAPIALEVRGGASDRPLPRVALALAAAALLLLAAIALHRGRAKRRRRGESAARPGRTDGDPGKALADFLAARLRCPPAAVIAPDLPAKLEAAGVTAELAERTAVLLQELVARRYDGGHGEEIEDGGGGDAAVVASLVDELERALEASG